MYLGTVQVEEVKLRITRNQAGALEIEADDEDLRRASEELQTKLMDLTRGKVMGMALEDLNGDGLIALFTKVKGEMETRGYFP